MRSEIYTNTGERNSRTIQWAGEILKQFSPDPEFFFLVSFLEKRFEVLFWWRLFGASLCRSFLARRFFLFTLFCRRFQLFRLVQLMEVRQLLQETHIIYFENNDRPIAQVQYGVQQPTALMFSGNSRKTAGEISPISSSSMAGMAFDGASKRDGSYTYKGFSAPHSLVEPTTLNSTLPANRPRLLVFLSRDLVSSSLERVCLENF